MDESSLEFDMVGIDAAIANAFRRILLAEVLGTVAKVGLWGGPHLENCLKPCSCSVAEHSSCSFFVNCSSGGLG